MTDETLTPQQLVSQAQVVSLVWGTATGSRGHIMIKVYTDGRSQSSLPPHRQRRARWAWVALDEQGHFIAQDTGTLPKATDIFDVEARGVINALRWVATQHVLAACYCDDLPLVCHVNRVVAMRKSRIQPLVWTIQGLLAQTGTALHWVPRDENRLANFLARHGWLTLTRQHQLVNSAGSPTPMEAP